jgi:hypothetical protein
MERISRIAFDISLLCDAVLSIIAKIAAREKPILAGSNHLGFN